MKKLIASASLVAVGATGLHGAPAPTLSRTQTTKPWSVSASLRGFFDDNYITIPHGPDSWGFEVAPSVALNWVRQQTVVTGAYRYSLKYYEDREDNKEDQSHEFRLRGDHRFSERFRISLDETFVLSQEPELQDPNLTTPGIRTLREEADAMRNNVRLGLDTQLTETIGMEFGYANGYYNYENEGDGSYSALLDRMEHLANLDVTYAVRPDLDALIGYQLGVIQHSSDDLLFVGGPPNETADIRDSTSHYFYVGSQGDLSPNLRLAARVGAQYYNFEDLDEDGVSPYVNINLTYIYAPGNNLQVGLTHRRNATDQPGAPGDIVSDQESTSAYASVSHRLTPKLTGNLLLQGQHSEFNDGPVDGEADNWLLAGASLDYQINPFLWLETGYNYDRLSSDLPDRSFTRNRVFLGVRASY